MNKKFVYQVGNNKKVILWCMANQMSRTAGIVCACEGHEGRLGVEVYVHS